ncbi:MAG: 50S ribosomal protein L18e [Candidatus Bathyarchaeota archaeon]|nr:50S ribosomal protein L18e [Candidatus Bathyarchaeota archaeon]
MRQDKSQNPELLNLVRSLRKKAKENDAAIWRDVADRLFSSRSRRVAVNLSRLNRYTKEKETIVVPGKVLGAGKLEHPITVAGFAFSNQARSKISKAKGKALTILELLKKNPKGSSVRIIG